MARPESFPSLSTAISSEGYPCFPSDLALRWLSAREQAARVHDQALPRATKHIAPAAARWRAYHPATFIVVTSLGAVELAEPGADRYVNRNPLLDWRSCSGPGRTDVDASSHRWPSRANLLKPPQHKRHSANFGDSAHMWRWPAPMCQPADFVLIMIALPRVPIGWVGRGNPVRGGINRGYRAADRHFCPE